MQPPGGATHAGVGATHARLGDARAPSATEAGRSAATVAFPGLHVPLLAAVVGEYVADEELPGTAVSRYAGYTCCIVSGAPQWVVLGEAETAWFRPAADQRPAQSWRPPLQTPTLAELNVLETIGLPPSMWTHLGLWDAFVRVSGGCVLLIPANSTRGFLLRRGFPPSDSGEHATQWLPVSMPTKEMGSSLRPKGVHLSTNGEHVWAFVHIQHPANIVVWRFALPQMETLAATSPPREGTPPRLLPYWTPELCAMDRFRLPTETGAGMSAVFADEPDMSRPGTVGFWFQLSAARPGSRSKLVHVQFGPAARGTLIPQQPLAVDDGSLQDTSVEMFTLPSEPKSIQAEISDLAVLPGTRRVLLLTRLSLGLLELDTNEYMELGRNPVSAADSVGINARGEWYSVVVDEAMRCARIDQLGAELITHMPIPRRFFAAPRCVPACHCAGAAAAAAATAWEAGAAAAAAATACEAGAAAAAAATACEAAAAPATAATACAASVATATPAGEPACAAPASG